MKVFPPKHPYGKVPEVVKETVDKIFEDAKTNTLTVIDSFKEGIQDLKKIADIEQATSAKLKEITGYEPAVSFKGLGKDIAKEYATELVNLSSQYKIQGNLKEFSHKPPKGNYGACRTFYNGDKIIMVGKSVATERLNEVASSKSRCDKENHQKSTLTHEFGHAIYTPDTSKSNTEFWDKIKTLHEEYKKEWRLHKPDSDEYKHLYLGNYAEGKTVEFLAEAFQEYKNYSHPSKYATEVGKLIDKYYGKK